MPEPCRRPFDEALLSGYLDDALVQGDEQRVRVHLDDCPTCRGLVAELTTVREATMSSTFDTPRDHEWSEAPRTAGSRLVRRLGWTVVVTWVIAVGACRISKRWQETESLVAHLILVGGVSGFAMLLLGVLLNRLQARKTDRYREVHK